MKNKDAKPMYVTFGDYRRFHSNPEQAFRSGFKVVYKYEATEKITAKMSLKRVKLVNRGSI